MNNLQSAYLLCPQNRQLDHGRTYMVIDIVSFVSWSYKNLAKHIDMFTSHSSCNPGNHFTIWAIQVILHLCTKHMQPSCIHVVTSCSSFSVDSLAAVGKYLGVKLTVIFPPLLGAGLWESIRHNIIVAESTTLTDQECPCCLATCCVKV